MAVLLIVDPSISSRGFIEADYWTTPASIYLCTQHQIQRSLIRLPSVVRWGIDIAIPHLTLWPRPAATAAADSLTVYSPTSNVL